MTIKHQNKNISAEIDITQLFDIEVEQDYGEITAVKLTRRDFYNDESKTTYDLMDYFYTEQEIDNFVKVHLVVYDSFSQLPQNNGISAGKSNYIYLIPDVNSEGIREGIYKEYVWVKIKDSSKYRTNETDHNDYILDEDHYNYEMLGSTEMDLSQIRRDIANLQSDKLDKTKVIDNLTTSTYNSSDPTALSAKQGKNLQDNKVDKTSIVTNLTTDDDTKVLSAKQGKNLQDNKIDKTSIVTNLTTDDDTKVLSAKQGKSLQDNKLDKSSIVDSVTDANTNPVTSNAVFDTISDVLDQLQSSSLLLSSNQPIIQNNETSRLVARIYGDITSNNNILFYEKKTGATDILLDTVPAINGVATYSYSGTGAGKKEFYAKCGSFQSEPYPVYDCTFYDDGVSTPHNTNYVNQNNIVVEYLSTGTKVYSTSTSGSRYYRTSISSNTDWRDSSTDYQIELDFEFERESGSASNVGFGGNGVDLHTLFGSTVLTGSGHLKIITDGDTANFYLDDWTTPVQKTMSSNNGLYFFIYKNASITFKDLKIYPI